MEPDLAPPPGCPAPASPTAYPARPGPQPSLAVAAVHAGEGGQEPRGASWGSTRSERDRLRWVAISEHASLYTNSPSPSSAAFSVAHPRALLSDSRRSPVPPPRNRSTREAVLDIPVAAPRLLSWCLAPGTSPLLGMLPTRSSHHLWQIPSQIWLPRRTRRLRRRPSSP
ncbi:hypothetical protein L226DRAFT_139606 [Lentinus tigrinus ALCF2SS1-7]|uniref:Uncharacterized protein n=1 Tax=Lentinus tigrinus ALCF2SS1-6 TaxID=1328759 RepID=A0A5C2SVE5_9APHY|nr:hypothetical protein L227DRAFT_28597 [Lentinus tigrinus ALCF2SS1-6]RPD81498.1 hypothetical protein L226DRAFT_139606 [Lentinus tigrinus ALCF2SS1-7]